MKTKTITVNGNKINGIAMAAKPRQHPRQMSKQLGSWFRDNDGNFYRTKPDGVYRLVRNVPDHVINEFKCFDCVTEQKAAAK